jgi:hypothetical protein
MKRRWRVKRCKSVVREDMNERFRKVAARCAKE